MFRRLKENLWRQKQALKVLCHLMEEEFSLLRAGNPQEVARIELSVQELTRQLMNERNSLHVLIGRIRPGAKRISEVKALMPPDVLKTTEAILAEIDKNEQACAMQASKNNHMAFALAEQSSRLLEFLRKELTPRQTPTYSAYGRMVARPDTEATLFRGRV